jgi:hypothetical protein
MKKVVIALTVALALGGCATVQQAVDSVGNAIGVVTTTVANPVTRERLYEFENGMIVAFAGLNAYKAACVRGALPQGCRTTIRGLQTYTRQLPAQLTIVRGFVKNNDQVNAALAYATLQQMYAEFKASATANGVKVQ